MSDFVRLVEVGPRDGLQNEKQLISAADKIALIEKLAACGFHNVEATSFVSPKWVPQLADAAEVFPAIRQLANVSYPVLVPNLQGYERAKSLGAKEVAVFTAASEAFSQKNTNASIEQTLERFAPIMAQAKSDGIRVRGYVSCVLGCPYQGEIAVSDVVRVALALYKAGCYEISLGDTIGVGTARKSSALLRAVADAIPISAVAGHFHDTYGQALANISAALDVGVRVFDSSVAGLGGCPYAKGASGNVASEDVVYFLQNSGMQTDVNLIELAKVGGWICELLGKHNASKAGTALLKKLAD